MGPYPVKRVVIGSVAVAWALLAVPAGAQQISKQGFNYNLPPCPQAAQYAGLRTINTDRFTDGSALPSCGGTLNGHPFKMVWTGRDWEKYGPSVAALPAVPAQNTVIRPVQPVQPAQPHTARLSDFHNVGSLTMLPQGAKAGDSTTYYKVGGTWYRVAQQVIASGGGNVIASGGGNVIASGGGNVIASGGGNIYYVLSQVIASGGGNIMPKNGSAVIGSNPNLQPRLGAGGGALR